MDTELEYFKYIVPCGLTKPVCSLRSLGLKVKRQAATEAIAASFAQVFGYQVAMAQEEMQETR